MAQTINISDSPAQVNYRPKRGDTFSRQFTIKVAGVAATITADTFLFTVKDSNGTQLYQLSVGDGITFGATGTAVWKFTPEQMRAFPVSVTTYYDIEWTRSSDGYVRTIQEGTITCRKDQTTS